VTGVGQQAPALPPLRDVIRRHGLDARKRFGQHFLLDENLTARIARAAGDMQGRTVVEIGPGPGGLTRALLRTDAVRVVAIELDRRCLVAIEELGEAFPGRLQVVAGDALAIDAAALVPPPRRIVANLPYNVATELLFRWLGDATAWESLTLMFQKEVADRLLAPPGGKDYGRLSVMTQWRCAVRRLFDLPPSAFVPPPKVTSTVVSLVPRPEPLAPADPTRLSAVVAAAFGQRRKMLRSSLRSLGVDTMALIEVAGVRPEARAEELTIPEFCALARALADVAPKPLQ